MEHSRKCPDFQCERTVVLVGMMGAGKTTVGRRLAPRIGLPFFDADSEIEKAAGMSVSELFQRHGEKSFRDGEARVIARLLDGPACVLATGGGALIRETTRLLIKEKGVTIWLKADTSTLARRATRRGTRPLLATGNPEETLARLMDEREVYYEQSDIHIESQPGPHSHTVSMIVASLADFLGHPLNKPKDTP